MPSVLSSPFFFFNDFIYLDFFFFLGPHLWHMEVPRLAVKSELRLLAFATATEMQDPSWVTAYGNAGSPTPGIEPISSWILAGFFSTAPQWELALGPFIFFSWWVWLKDYQYCSSLQNQLLNLFYCFYSSILFISALIFNIYLFY